MIEVKSVDQLITLLEDPKNFLTHSALYDGRFLISLESDWDFSSPLAIIEGYCEYQQEEIVLLGDVNAILNSWLKIEVVKWVVLPQSHELFKFTIWGGLVWLSPDDHERLRALKGTELRA